MFYNISNHPSAKWESSQILAAQKLGGEIVDVKFPEVNPEASIVEVTQLAKDLVGSLNIGHKDVALVQGEFTLVLNLVCELNWLEVRCVAATSKREVVETKGPDGATLKSARFSFVQFRSYY